MIKRRKYETGKILLEVSRVVNSSMDPDEVSKFMKNLLLSTITSLTGAIDAKDSYASGRSERVMKYTVATDRPY